VTAPLRLELCEPAPPLSTLQAAPPLEASRQELQARAELRRFRRHHAELANVGALTDDGRRAATTCLRGSDLARWKSLPFTFTVAVVQELLLPHFAGARPATVDGLLRFVGYVAKAYLAGRRALPESPAGPAWSAWRPSTSRTGATSQAAS
jgi:hypothetical protein